MIQKKVNETYEDIKEVTSPKIKKGQTIANRNRRKGTNNDLENITQNTKDRATQTRQITGSTVMLTFMI